MNGVARPMKIRWKVAGFRALRTSPGVTRDIAARAEVIAFACGPGFVARSNTGRNRSRAAVITADARAIRRNARDNTIMRNLNAGR